MENITDLNTLTIAELLAYLAKQESFSPKSGMCIQVEQAAFNSHIDRKTMWEAKIEIENFMEYIATNWGTPPEAYLRDAIYLASRLASFAEIDQLCREIYLNWDNRFNLVNDFINNHRWGN